MFVIDMALLTLQKEEIGERLAHPAGSCIDTNPTTSKTDLMHKHFFVKVRNKQSKFVNNN